MSVVVFSNKGVMDVRSITMFGVSSKIKADALGMFGSGLKYSIAILLREGCSIAIKTGGNYYVFSTEKDKIREDDFDVVYMNEEPLSFTTELGKGWSMWQAYRELHCNCTDENGSVQLLQDTFSLDFLEEDSTQVIVSGKKFIEAYQDRESIILSTAPIYTSSTVDIHPRCSNYIYYRGIRVYSPQKPTAYTYNIKDSMELTEDRTLKEAYKAGYKIASALARCTDQSICERILEVDQSFFEAYLNFAGDIPSQEFKNVVTKHVKNYNNKLNRSAAEICKVSILGSLDLLESKPLKVIDVKRMHKAISFCKAMGYNVEEYPIIVSDFLGEGVLGVAHNEKIFISDKAFLEGTKRLAGTILEEYLHLKHGFEDETRRFQDYLLDKVMSLQEEIIGEIL